MARKQSGLPPSFDIDIPRPEDGPVKLGDYLDELEAAPPALRVVPQKKAEESKVIELPRPAAPAHPLPPKPRCPRSPARPPRSRLRRNAAGSERALSESKSMQRLKR